MCAFHCRWFITDGFYCMDLRMVYCVVYCRYSRWLWFPYESYTMIRHMRWVSQMTADDVQVRDCLHVTDKPNANGIHFLNNFLEDISPFLWGHWYPCFGLLVTSIPGFKARLGSLFRVWQRHMMIHVPRHSPLVNAWNCVWCLSTLQTSPVMEKNARFKLKFTASNHIQQLFIVNRTLYDIVHTDLKLHIKVNVFFWCQQRIGIVIKLKDILLCPHHSNLHS